jgi:hypothetical protein
MLNGVPVAEVYADLTGAGLGGKSDVTKAKPLAENLNVCFQGSVRVGRFDITGELARKWLAQSNNPNCKPNSEVLRPLTNGKDITSRNRGDWIIDFFNMEEYEASLFEKPFNHVVENVKAYRQENRDAIRKKYWWRHGRTGDSLRAAMQGLPRCIATPQVAKHRLFVFVHSRVFAESTVLVIARADDTTFGILHSRFHELWSLRLCTWLGKGSDPRYTPTTTFETFPFPEGLTPADTAGPVETLDERVVLPSVAPELRPVALAIAQAAHRLNVHRENWLNPADWVDRVPEVVPGYPDRIIPKPGREKDLKARTLTNLYNQRPHWLDNGPPGPRCGGGGGLWLG